MATSTTMNVFKTTKSLFKEILTEVFTEVEKIRKERGLRRTGERKKSKKERKGIDKGDGRWYTIGAATESGSAETGQEKS